MNQTLIVLIWKVKNSISSSDFDTELFFFTVIYIEHIIAWIYNNSRYSKNNKEEKLSYFKYIIESIFNAVVKYLV